MKLFVDQNEHIVPGKVKAVSFRREVFWPTDPMTSITIKEELDIEDETFYDLQAFTLNSRDQITEVESRELDLEEQTNVRRSTRSRN